MKILFVILLTVILNSVALAQNEQAPITEKANTQGLRGPVASAMAPKIGEVSAMISPPMPDA